MTTVSRRSRDPSWARRSSPRSCPYRPRRCVSPASTPSAASTEVPLDTVLAAMVGVHVVIGIGEAVITAATIGSVLAVRPDLVYGARSLLPRPSLRAGVVSPAYAGRKVRP